MAKTILTHKRLKELLHYDPMTGLFTWKERLSNRVKAGDVAGTIKSGYVFIGIDTNIYRAHRLVWLYVRGKFPPNEIDHINHDKSDNRVNNLSLATHKENGRNQSLNKTNTSGVMGVNWHKSRNRWRARIMVNQSEIYLGRFVNFIDAVAARKAAEKKYGFHENHGINFA